MPSLRDLTQPNKLFLHLKTDFVIPDVADLQQVLKPMHNAKCNT